MLFALAACAQAPPATPVPGSARTSPLPPKRQPVPPDLLARVEQSRQLGRAIFLQDKASARGSDVLLSKGAPDARIRGWVTEGRGDGRWTVQFFMLEGDQLLVVREVRLWEEGAEVEAFSPPRALSTDAEAMARAGRTAAWAVGGPCAGAYNTVVLPAALIGEQGWLVYRLAATNRPNELVLAGHQRIRVSTDGREILERVPLSLGCLIEGWPEAHDGKLAGLYMNQPIAEWPVETSVFTSLLYALPITLLTQRGIWAVDGEKVDYLGK
jgi:hypothetical protein